MVSGFADKKHAFASPTADFHVLSTSAMDDGSGRAALAHLGGAPAPDGYSDTFRDD